MRLGFTLIEMLVVVAVIVALAGMSYPVMTSMKAKADISATTQLVHTVAAAIEAYQIKSITGKDGKLYHAWAVDQDLSQPYPTDHRYMDGIPAQYSAPDLMVTRAPDWYKGFIFMTGFNVPSKTSLDAKGRIKDRFNQPLHIDWKAHTYGASDFGVWSTGPDGRLSDDTAIQGTDADDICSWKNSDE
jgi:prepilin-type N-terminal cleavage/methylation domain-containing protein